MLTMLDDNISSKPRVVPTCPVFGSCGGCLYQDIPYTQELEIKEQHLRDILSDAVQVDGKAFEPVVASPRPYHYRSRIDLKMVRAKDRRVLIGFTPKAGYGLVTVDQCPIADKGISDFIPELKNQVASTLPEKYRRANLTVRTGDEGKVFWGGIGRRSCRLTEDNYLWTEINGRRIFYSLDTFFQANLSILPELFKSIEALDIWENKPILYDLYGGVGLFGVGLAHRVRKIILIEDCKPSVKLARHNRTYNQLSSFEIIEGKVEDHFDDVLRDDKDIQKVAIIDPPRAGLSKSALGLMAQARPLDHILYLSCNPEALARDLSGLTKNGWQIERVIPFDFFPKTRHLETLVLLANRQW